MEEAQFPVCARGPLHGPQGEERAPGPKQARAEGSSLGLGCSGKNSRRATERRRGGRRLAPSSSLRRTCARSRAGAGTTTSPRRARGPLFGGGGWGQLRVLPGRLGSLLDGRGWAGHRESARGAPGGFRPGWMRGCQAAAPPLPILSAPGVSKANGRLGLATAAKAIGQRLMKRTPPFYRVRRAGSPPSPRQSHDVLPPRRACRAPPAPRPLAGAWPRRRSS